MFGDLLIVPSRSVWLVIGKVSRSTMNREGYKEHKCMGFRHLMHAVMNVIYVPITKHI